jgi:hypothetical protein
MRKQEQQGKTIDLLLVGVVVVLAVLLVLVILSSFRSYQRYETLRAHRAYLREPNATVQPWMTMQTVARRFNVSQEAVCGAFGLNRSCSSRSPLSAICQQQRLNCTDVISKLDSLRKQ